MIFNAIAGFFSPRISTQTLFTRILRRKKGRNTRLM